MFNFFCKKSLKVSTPKDICDAIFLSREMRYHMKYFTIKRGILVHSSNIMKEYEKIDKFMNLLENFRVAEIINSVKFNNKICKGRIGYNPYNLFAAIIYCFAKFKGTLRDIEDKCLFDVKVYY